MMEAETDDRYLRYIVAYHNRRILEEGPAIGIDPLDHMHSFMQFGHAVVGPAQGFRPTSLDDR